MSALPSGLEQKIAHARSIGESPGALGTLPCRNIGELLSAQVAAHGEKPWLIFYNNNLTRTAYTYRHFFELVGKTVNLLRSLGIQRGDRIATVAFNHPDTVVQYFAAFALGAVLVPINTGEDDKRIGYILDHSKAKLAFVRQPYLKRVTRILAASPGVERIVVVRSHAVTTDAGDAIDFHRTLHEMPPDIVGIPPVSSEDEALIVYTSGTTGVPKGVVLTQGNLMVDASAIAAWHGMDADQRMMCVLPIHHVNGTIVTLLTPLWFGGSVVLNQKFHVHHFFDLLSRERVQVVSVVPTLLQFLLHENIDLSQYDLSRFRHIICGAGPLTVELATNFEDRYHLPIAHGYGLSETTCYSCFLPLDLSAAEHRSWLADHGFPSIGVPIPANEMAIHDGHGRELGEGIRGEIVIRGQNVMRCYYGNPEANEKVFTFGWFRSGDEGFYRIDPKGRKFFFITGRIKELIIRGGVNISPFEIDEVLMGIPGVKTGLAVGFENDWYGEEIGAYVQRKEGIELTEQEVLDYCRKSLPFQKSPKVIVFGNDIPVTSTGKYQRSRLRPLFGKWKTTQFTGRTGQNP